MLGHMCSLWLWRLYLI